MNRGNSTFRGFGRFLVPAFGLLAGLVLAAPVRADVIYTYTGNPFTSFLGSYQCTAGVGECALTDTLTLSALLPANLTVPGGYAFTPLSFSFTDGVNTLTQNNAPFIQQFVVYATDGAGIPTLWNISAGTGGSCPRVQMQTEAQGTIQTNDISLQYDAGCTLTAAYNGNPFALPGIGGDPGTWSVQATATPEPNALLLFGTGLAALACLVRRTES